MFFKRIEMIEDEEERTYLWCYFYLFYFQFFVFFIQSVVTHRMVLFLLVPFIKRYGLLKL